MSQSRSGYEDVEELVDPDGIVAVISRRKATGDLFVAIFKQFDRQGVPMKTNFFSASHAPAVHRIVDLAVARMAALRLEWGMRKR
jgi:hypothetical protein